MKYQCRWCLNEAKHFWQFSELGGLPGGMLQYIATCNHHHRAAVIFGYIQVSQKEYLAYHIMKT